MPQITHWNSGTEGSDDSWNLVRLGGKFLWVARVDVDIPDGLDVQKPKGGKGARIKDNGDPPKRIKIRLQLDGRPELNAFAAARSTLLARRKDGARDPIAIEHPNTAFWGITAVVIGAIKSPQPDAVNGWIIEIDALEWRPDLFGVAQQQKKPQDTGDNDRDAWAPYVNDAAQGNSPATAELAQRNLEGRS